NRPRLPRSRSMPLPAADQSEAGTSTTKRSFGRRVLASARARRWLLLGLSVVAAVWLVRFVQEHRRRAVMASLSWVASEDANRDQLPMTQDIWEQLALAPGMSVADIGAG